MKAKTLSKRRSRRSASSSAMASSTALPASTCSRFLRVAISIILARAVDRGDRSRRQPLGDQGDRDAVAAADLEQAVGRADLQSVDRPDKPLRCLARHAPGIASRAGEAQADLLDERLGGRIIADRQGGFGWTEPSEELFRFHLAEVRELGGYLCGRRLYETMLVWETDPSMRDNGLRAAFADVWCAIPKVVFSRTLDSVQGNARLAEGSVAEEVVAALDATDKDVSSRRRRPGCGGDRVRPRRRVAHASLSVVVGGGTPFLPPATDTSRWT